MVPDDDESSKTVSVSYVAANPVSKISWRISLEEAVTYGFDVIKGVLVCLVIVICLFILSFLTFLSYLDLQGPANQQMMRTIMLGVSIASAIGGFLLFLAIQIGLMYKFGGDILLRGGKAHNLVKTKK